MVDMDLDDYNDIYDKIMNETSVDGDQFMKLHD